MKNIKQNAMRLFFLLFLTNGVGYVGSAFMTQDTMNWYDTLSQSVLTPPDFVFPIVWTCLFFMMAISAFLVWNKASPRYFVMQLAMNLAWTFTFFYLREVVVACFVILALLYCVFRTILDFYRVNRVSGWLMVPTFVWGLFALYLNIYVAMYN